MTEVRLGLLRVSKLFAPRSGDRLVTRPRLLVRVDESRACGLGLISAPAGFGKTTIINQWLAWRGEQAAWLSLDAGDNQQQRFFTYLVAAIRRVVPEACPQLAAQLESEHIPPRYLADLLLNDLAALPCGLTLVIDDYHVVNSEAIHTALLRVVSDLPPGVHVLITTRSDPPWPLSRLHGRGLLVELRAADLRFTPQEAGALLAQDAGADARSDLAELLCERTEGWAVGLKLAQLSLRTSLDAHAFAAGFRGTDRRVTDYLLDEVLTGLPPPVQEFLLASALPERFCTELCASLTEGEEVRDAAAMIEEVEQRNLFLVALDANRTWFRYHHLFRDMLVQRGRTHWGYKRIEQLQRRASEWFRGRELIEEAVRHALLAGDVALATATIEGSFKALLERERSFLSLPPLLALLPEQAIQASPTLLLVRAYISYMHWDFVTMVGLADRAEELLARNSSSAGPGAAEELCGDIAMLRSALAFWSGDAQKALTLAESACERISTARPFVHSIATSYLGGADTISGMDERGTALLRARLAEVDTASSAAGHLLLALGLLALMSGRLDRLTHDAGQLAKSVAGREIYMVSWGQYLLGRLHYERDELDAARECFTRATAYPYSTHERAYHDALTGLARIATIRGCHEQAAAYAGLARAFAEERDNAVLREASAACEAGLALAAGDHVRAIWLAGLISPDAYTGTACWLEQPRQRRAALQIARATPGSLAEAVADLRRYLAEAVAAHNIYRQVHVGALLGVALAAQGDQNGALAAIERVVALAAPRGLLRSLVDYGPEVAGLLARLPRDHEHRLYISGVLSRFAQTAEVPAPRNERRVGEGLDLTFRELEVLVLVAQQLTDAEIAARLLVSINTVKTHTGNIYSKLAVQGRRRAIFRARELGLI